MDQETAESGSQLLEYQLPACEAVREVDIEIEDDESVSDEGRGNVSAKRKTGDGVYALEEFCNVSSLSGGRASLYADVGRLKEGELGKCQSGEIYISFSLSYYRYRLRPYNVSPTAPLNRSLCASADQTSFSLFSPFLIQLFSSEIRNDSIFIFPSLSLDLSRTMSAHIAPPFRADHIGSLKRTSTPSETASENLFPRSLSPSSK